MKVCPKCGQSFADGFTYCPKDASQLERYDLRARMSRQDEFHFLFESEPLIVRLKRELAGAIDELRLNPRAFLSGLLRGEGSTRQRKRLLQAGVATAVIAYASVTLAVFVIGLFKSDRLVDAAVDEYPHNEVRLIFPDVPVKVERVKDVTKPGAGFLGGSAERPHPERAQGGGGRDDNAPAIKGGMPTPSLLPQVNPPDLKPPKLNPALIAVETIYADDAFRRRISEKYGLPDGQENIQSLGNGKGPGVGPGDGSGYGPGRKGNLGDGEMSIGSRPPTGTGDGVYQQSRNLRPTILYREKAKYTEEARQNRIQGSVVLSVVFGADGRIHNIRTVRSLPYGLTETSIEAAQRIRFQPAVLNGRPVSVQVTLEFNFALY
jgi:TonB family protein